MLSLAAFIILIMLLAQSILRVYGQSTLPYRNNGGLRLRFTARDFVQASCGTRANLNRAWSPSDFNGNTHISFDTDPIACPFFADVAEGRLLPHPDFEPDMNFATVGTSGLTSVTPQTKPIIHYASNAAYTRGTNPIVDVSLTHYDESGIPKPKFCPGGTGKCGVSRTQAPKRAVASATSFHSWFNDDPRINKRSGFQMELKKSEGANDTFFYDSHTFFPLDDVQRCEAVMGRVDCRNGGKAWPASGRRSTGFPQPKEDCNPLNELNATYTCTRSGNICVCDDLGKPRINAAHNYLFPDELHTFFQFTGGVVEFKGDDDFYAFVNGRLAIDLGGIHEPILTSLDLSNPQTAKALGLDVLGGIYSLDVYHAERRSPGSTFSFTTSLSGACTVLDVGVRTSSLTWMNHEPWILQPNDFNAAGAAYVSRPVDVGDGGFRLRASFRLSRAEASPWGVALVMHSDPRGATLVSDTDGHFGQPRAYYAAGYMAVEMDFSNSTSREIRLMRDGQVTRRAQIFGVFHDWSIKPIEIEVIHYGHHPNWIDVYVDNDLYLQERDVPDLFRRKSQGVYVGFTASSRGDKARFPESAGVELLDLSIDTVPAVAEGSVVETRWREPTVQSVDENNEFDVKILVDFYTFDGCGRSTSGSSILLASAELLGANRRELPVTRVVWSENQHDLNHHVFVFQPNRRVLEALSDHRGSRRNEALELTFDALRVRLVDASGGVFHRTLNVSSVTFTSREIPLATSETEDSLSARAELPWMKIGAGIGGGLLLFVLLIGFGIRKWRRSWRFNKSFVDPGKLARAERDVFYNGDLGNLDQLSKRLHQQRLEISRLRAVDFNLRNGVDSQSIETKRELIAACEGMRNEVRRLKELLENRHVRDEGDAYFARVVRECAKEMHPETSATHKAVWLDLV